MISAFYKYVLLSFVFALSTPVLSVAYDTPSNDIESQAREYIAQFKNDRINQSLRDLGFESQEDLDNAELGAVFRIYSIRLDKLLDQFIPLNLQSLIVPTNQWEFVVFAGGKAKTILKGSVDDGKLFIYEMGSSGGARLLAGFMASFPASSGYKYRYIQDSSGLALMEVSQGDNVIGILSFTDKRMHLPGRANGKFMTSDLSDSKTVLLNLRYSEKERRMLWRRSPMNKNPGTYKYPTFLGDTPFDLYDN